MKLVIRWSTSILFVALVVSGCSGTDSGDARKPDRPAKTTTTTLTLEQEVEAAYLRWWEVTDRAYLELDTSGLEEVSARDDLALRIREIEERKREGRPMLSKVEHDYRVSILGPAKASVTDTFRNHSVRLDPMTRQPVEADPNEVISVTFTMERLEGAWKVVFTATSPA